MPVPTAISRFALPRSATFPQRPREAGGTQHDERVDALDGALQSAVDKRDAIESDVMPAKRPAARKQAAIDSTRVVAAAVVPYAVELASRLTDARDRAGLARKLNPNDLNANGGTAFDTVDLSNRVQHVRTTLPALPDHALIAAVRNIFDPATGKPDVLAAYAIDTAPAWVRDAIAQRAAVDLDAMRETLLARLNPTAAAQLETVTYLAQQASYLVERAQRVTEETWGVDATNGNAFEPARDALQRALRTAPRAG